MERGFTAIYNNKAIPLVSAAERQFITVKTLKLLGIGPTKNGPDWRLVL